MSSHKIRVLRTDNHLPVQDAKQNKVNLNGEEVTVTSWASSSMQIISTYNINGRNNKKYTGLSITVERILLREILGMHYTELVHDNWEKEKQAYYSGLFVDVPYEGLELEIGLTEDNDNEVSESNLPINIDHYIKYKALFERHPYVAKDKETAFGHSFMKFYVVDQINDEKEAERFLVLQDKALGLYFQIKEDYRKLRKFIILLTGDNLPKSEIALPGLQKKLRDILDRRPKDFIDLYNNPEIDTLAFISSLRFYKLIEIRVGGSVWDTRSLRKIANDEKDMIMFLKEKETNAEILAQWQREIEEKRQLLDRV